jgi:hypothetical protein
MATYRSDLVSAHVRMLTSLASLGLLEADREDHLTVLPLGVRFQVGAKTLVPGIFRWIVGITIPGFTTLEYHDTDILAGMLLETRQ